jgi:hypothetical protein
MITIKESFTTNSSSTTFKFMVDKERLKKVIEDNLDYIINEVIKHSTYEKDHVISYLDSIKREISKCKKKFIYINDDVYDSDLDFYIFYILYGLLSGKEVEFSTYNYVEYKDIVDDKNILNNNEKVNVLRLSDTFDYERINDYFNILSKFIKHITIKFDDATVTSLDELKNRLYMEILDDKKKDELFMDIFNAFGVVTLNSNNVYNISFSIRKSLLVFIVIDIIDVKISDVKEIQKCLNENTFSRSSIILLENGKETYLDLDDLAYVNKFEKLF